MSGQLASERQSPINLANPIFADFGKDCLGIKWKWSIQGRPSVEHHGAIEFGSDERQFVILNRRKYQHVIKSTTKRMCYTEQVAKLHEIVCHLSVYLLSGCSPHFCDAG